MEKILIAEDDKEISRLMCEFLSGQGYGTISAANGLDAVKLLRESGGDISLMLLDLMLPFRSGDMVLQAVREFSDIPVIVVSAKSDTRSKIDMIKMGADDYITKPFDLDELLARTEAVLRRCGSRKDELTELTYKGLKLDTVSGTASVNDKLLVLTSKEFAILELMLRNRKKLFSKANLFESVWGETYFGDDSTIKVHMSNIRSKLKKLDPDEEYIETVWGMGYRLMN